MKDLTQKLWSSHSVRDESKISSSEEIHHVTSDENEFKTVNDLFVDNDSNDSSSNNFVSTALFMHSVSSVTVFDVTAHQDREQFRDSERECQSADHCFIDSEISDSVYDWVNVSFKEKKFRLNESVKNTEKSKSSDSDNSLKISLLSMKNWLQLTALCLSEQDVMSENEKKFISETENKKREKKNNEEKFLNFN